MSERKGAMILDSLVQGMAVILLLVLLVGMWEKAQHLREGSARWHPVLLATKFRRRHATLLLVAALIGDTLAIWLLATNAKVGGVTAFALLGAYTAAALTSESIRTSQSSCQCLGQVLDTTGWVPLTARNILLMTASASVALRPVSLWPLTGPAVVFGVGFLLLLGSLRVFSSVSVETR